MVNEKKYTVTQARLVIVLILCFATVTDIVSSLVAKRELMGSIRWFLVLGPVFVFQHQFRIVRIVLLSVIAIFVVVNLIALIIAMDVATVADFLNHVIFLPGAVPLYAAISFITILIFIFLRKYDVWK